MSQIKTFSLNAAQIEPEFGGGSDTVPTGWYKCHIGSLTLAETKSKKGINAAVTFVVASGFYAGKSITDTYNLISDKGEANELSQKRLAAIGHSVGQLQMIVSGQVNPNLLKKPIIARLKLEEDTYNGDTIIRNRVDGVRNASEQMQTVEEEIEAVATVRKQRAANTQQLFGEQQSFAPTAQVGTNPFLPTEQAAPPVNPFAQTQQQAAPPVVENVTPFASGVEPVAQEQAPVDPFSQAQSTPAPADPFAQTAQQQAPTAKPSWLASL